MYNTIKDILLIMTIIMYPILTMGFLYIKLTRRFEESTLNNERREILEKRNYMLDKDLEYQKYKHLEINRDSYEIYKGELENMIRVFTDNEMNREYGIQFSMKMRMDIDLDVDDYLKISRNVFDAVMDNMGNPMKGFLVSYLGAGYITNYIRFRVIQIAAELAKDVRLEVNVPGVVK